MWGLGLFAFIGLWAALTRPGSTADYLWPTLAGAAAGAFTLARLADAAGRLSALPARPRLGTGTDPAVPGQAVPGAARPASEMLTPPDLPVPPAETSPPAETGPAAETGPPAAEAPRVPGGTTPSSPRGPGTGSSFTFLPNPDDQGPPRGPARRRFLVGSGIAAAAAVAGTVGGRQLATRRDVTLARSALRFPRPAVAAPPLPAGSDLHIPGLSSFITPNDSFYRVDTALLLPQVDPSTWQLRIHGMVQREVTITFAELLRRPLIEAYITLTCVSDPVGGPYVGNAKWLGARLADLIRQARPRAGASQLLCTSVDGFTSGTPLQVVLDGRDALLTVAMNGTALPVAHGFPARMVIPGLYGYVSATKWVTDIEVTTFADATAYWATRGWSQQAPIKTESRIDVPAIGSALRPGPTQVAGVAWAQHKGVAAVEVRVDRGPWHEARLAAVPDIDTWRQWVWDWPATPGRHVIEARATDKTGYTQTAVQAQPPPNGASGYPSAAVTVRSS
jgi:DMSO/TMAO reductase YedYZ molybdopterin-dependent catalytic subunit